MIFGIITGRLGDVLVFLFFYGTLRSFSGGVHCKSKAGCFCLSMAILLIPIYTSEWIMGIVNTPVLIIIGIMAVVAILILSPVESINKPLEVNWKTKFQLPYASDWNLLLQGYGVELTSPNIPAWY